jgi:hypothetical protein
VRSPKVLTSIFICPESKEAVVAHAPEFTWAELQLRSFFFKTHYELIHHVNIFTYILSL